MELNEQQRQAVEHLDGPCLVTANPGSGKTAIIVERVVRLIRRGVIARNIIAVTFTNKSGNEMKQRICKALNTQKPGFFIGTFHSLCARIIRKIGPGRGYSSNFTILDEKDQIDAIMQISRYLQYDIKIGDARRIGHILNFYRDQMEDFSWVKYNLRNEPMIEIAQRYIDRCRKNNMLDFSGLISECIRIIEENKDGIKEKIQNTFKYILVDEYHDSNKNQAYLVKLLGEKYGNIMIVADKNQSIYKFRGARYQNIQDFIDRYDNCKIIELPMNYRSTPEIIDVASKLIKYNDNNEKFKMITNNKSGEAVKCYSFIDQIKESEWVAGRIKKMVDEGGWAYRDMACIYRVNKLSQPLEQSLMNAGVNYKNVGSYNFFDRTECRDVLSALRLLVNKKDNVSFYRVAKLFSGMGNITVGKIEKKAEENEISLIDACLEFKKESNSAKVKDICQKIYDIYSQDRDFSNPAKCLSDIVEQLDYKNYLSNKYDGGAIERIENVEQLIDSCIEFSGEGALFKYLQNVSLVNDKNKEDEEKDDYVSLLSIHSAKGLEFEVCFVVGFEQDIIPHNLAVNEDSEGIYEERRLGYVAISRAKKILYITYCRNRKSFGAYGRTIYRKTKPSQFLYECGLIKEK